MVSEESYGVGSVYEGEESQSGKVRALIVPRKDGRVDGRGRAVQAERARVA